MTDDRLAAAVRQQVAERAGQTCEYCLLPAGVAFFAHEVDHVVARKHGGTSDVANLALACWRCNRYKGSDLATLDRETGALVRLFDYINLAPANVRLCRQSGGRRGIRSPTL